MLSVETKGMDSVDGSQERTKSHRVGGVGEVEKAKASGALFQRELELEVLGILVGEQGGVDLEELERCVDHHGVVLLEVGGGVLTGVASCYPPCSRKQVGRKHAVTSLEMPLFIVSPKSARLQNLRNWAS